MALVRWFMAMEMPFSVEVSTVDVRVSLVSGGSRGIRMAPLPCSTDSTPSAPYWFRGCRVSGGQIFFMGDRLLVDAVPSLRTRRPAV